MSIGKVHLVVEGMSCGGCVASVSKIIKRIEGVSDVDAKIGSADFTAVDPVVKGAVVATALTKAGYPTRVLPSKE